LGYTLYYELKKNGLLLSEADMLIATIAFKQSYLSYKR